MVDPFRFVWFLENARKRKKKNTESLDDMENKVKRKWEGKC